MSIRPLILGFILVSSTIADSAAPRIRVHGGDFDRHNAVVRFTAPSEWRAFNELVDGQGQSLALQIRSSGEAAFIEPSLKAGESRIYSLAAGNSAVEEKLRVTTAKLDSLLQVTVPGLPPLTYHTIPAPLPRADIAPIYARGGYIHPVLSPNGRQVTDDYPPNHIHHHGIWYAWTKTKFGNIDPDFWNMGQGKGTVEFAELGETWSGFVHGGWSAAHSHRELMSNDKAEVLRESWTVHVYRATPLAGRLKYSLFDIDAVQSCVTDKPLHLPPYHYGGTGIRGNRLWDGKDNAFFLTSEGITNRVQGNESRARWCYMGGLVDGKQTGIAILCHPDNYRYPQPVRLHPTEPYFSYAPQQMGEMEIDPGKPYVMKYRHVVFDGAPEAAWLESQFADYAHPAVVDLLPQ